LKLIALSDPLVGWCRSLGEDRVVAIFNLSAEPVTIPVRDLPSYTVASELGFAVAPEDGELRLPPFGISIGDEHGYR
jgi:hypothetical protein